MPEKIQIKYGWNLLSLRAVAIMLEFHQSLKVETRLSYLSELSSIFSFFGWDSPIFLFCFHFSFYINLPKTKKPFFATI